MSLHRTLALIILLCAPLAWTAGPSGRFIVALPLLLFGPGFLLDCLLHPLPVTSTFARPTLWLGYSLSIIPLLYLWITTIGLALSATTLTVLSIMCGVAVLVYIWRSASSEAAPAHAVVRRAQSSTQFAALAMLVLLGLTLWLRFVQIEHLALPAWVDSVHHALMIRVAAERGQAPLSLVPYMPVEQLPYHWGYHVVLATVMQVTRLDLPTAMLWSGQVLSALHVLTCGALAAYLWRKPWAGIVAGVVVGALSTFPAYYTSWGRYTQLAGLLLLPPLAIAWREALRTASLRWYGSVALLLAGLSLVHFRVLLFALCLLMVMGGAQLATQEHVPWRKHALGMVLGFGLPLILTAPWLWLLVTRTLERVAQSSSYVINEGGSAIAPGLLWAGLNRWLIPLALLAALWSLARRSRAAVEQTAWVAAMFLAANPWLVGLPSLWLVSNESVVISLFVPISVMIGGGACFLAEWLAGSAGTSRQGDKATGRQEATIENREPIHSTDVTLTSSHLSIWAHNAIAHRRIAVHALALLVLVSIGLWGGWRMRGIVNPATVFATAADLKAIHWAEKHTAPDARFLINATAWQPGSERGTDGGWWLLPLAGRWVSTPPVLAIYGPPDYIRAAQERSQFIANFHAGQEQQLFNLIACDHINYIYFGSQRGAITPEVFANRQGYRTVYHDDGVTILAVPQETCYDRNNEQQGN